jgi:DNA-binding transcriptional LysR family regulator
MGSQIDSCNGDIMPVNISAVDLKLLVVFDAVMNEKSVSKAAVRIGMSQPAVSNALNRLRDQLQDQLFIRTAEGVRPTERAAEMAADVADGLRHLQVALEPRSLSMASKHWKFVIAMSEQTMIAILPRLLKVTAASPNSITLHIKPKSNKNIQQELDSGEVDLAVGTIPSLPPRFDKVPLYHDKYVMMMAKDNPLSTRGISAEKFPKVEQIAVRGNLESHTQIDRDLQACRATRNVVMNVTQYQVVPKVLKATRLISLVPRSVILDFDPEEFCFQEIPFNIPEVEIVAVAHRSRRQNPAIRWLQNAMQEACSDLTRILKEPVSQPGRGGLFR